MFLHWSVQDRIAGDQGVLLKPKTNMGEMHLGYKITGKSKGQFSLEQDYVNGMLHFQPQHRKLAIRNINYLYRFSLREKSSNAYSWNQAIALK